MTKSEAGGVCDPSVGQFDPKRSAEVVTMVVERGNRGGLGPGDLDQKLELQGLFTLAHGQHLPTASEERVVGDIELGCQAEAAQEL